MDYFELSQEERQADNDSSEQFELAMEQMWEEAQVEKLMPAFVAYLNANHLAIVPDTYLKQ